MCIESIGDISTEFPDTLALCSSLPPPVASFPDRLTSKAPSSCKAPLQGQRPLLEEPNSFYWLLAAQKRYEEQTQESLRGFDRATQEQQTHLDQISEAKNEFLTKYAQELTQQGTWSTLHQISQWVATSGSVGIGLACLSTGAGTAGALLLASAGVGALNQVLLQTHGWTLLSRHIARCEESQAKVENFLKASASMISLGLGLAGGNSLHQSGHLTTLLNSSLTQRIGALFSSIGSALQAISQFQIARVESKVQEGQATLKCLDGRVVLTQEELSEEQRTIQKRIEGSSKLNETLQLIVSNS